LGSGDILLPLNTEGSKSFKEESADEPALNNNAGQMNEQNDEQNNAQGKDSYSIRVVGPGIDSQIEINDPGDLEIVDAMISKIKSSFSDF
jgi:hypothetical protein